MKYSLNRAERSLAAYLGKHRAATNRRYGPNRYKMGKQSQEEIDLEGAAAEIAFCALFNVSADLELEGWADYDCVLPDGRRVDVKTTTYLNGRLLATLNKAAKPADIYVLMVGKFPNYKLVGYATAEELFKHENIGDLKHGKGYMLEQKDLHEIHPASDYAQAHTG